MGGGRVAEEKLKEWADAFEVLSHPIRLGILLILYGSEVLESLTPCLTYTQIKEIMEMPSESALAHHLKRLTDAKLVEKIAAKNEANRVYPEYRIGERGEKLLVQTGLADALIDYMKGHLLKQT